MFWICVAASAVNLGIVIVTSQIPGSNLPFQALLTMGVLLLAAVFHFKAGDQLNVKSDAEILERATEIRNANREARDANLKALGFEDVPEDVKRGKK